MYLIIEYPACCDPFTEPRDATEQIKVCDKERLMIDFVGSHTLVRMYVEATVRCRSYQLVTR